MIPANDVPVFRPKDKAEADDIKSNYSGGIVFLSPNYAEKSDEEIRAILVCARRPEHPDCEVAESVELIMVLPLGLRTDYTNVQDTIDPKCVTLEAAKLRHLLGKGLPNDPRM